jgi:hypothetical protein
LQQNVTDAFTGRSKVVNFSMALYSVLRFLGIMPRARDLSAHMKALRAFDVAVVERQLLARYNEHVQSLLRQPAAGGGERSMMAAYFGSHGVPTLGTTPPWYRIRVPHKVARRFLRWRLGCHYLRVNTGRWARPPLARSSRKCVRCAYQWQDKARVPVDDEQHCLIDCQDPEVAAARQRLEAAIRRKHAHPAMNSVQQLFATVEETQSKHLQRELMSFVAVCYRVAEQQHDAWLRQPHQERRILRLTQLLEQMGPPPLPSSSDDESSVLSELSELSELHEVSDEEYEPLEPWDEFQPATDC